ncbi:MAG: hypothetical protein JXB13_01935 [Phycisphaerae bacterium]|nr:hypothetical protein [Phycisphaerae bacterium]
MATTTERTTERMHRGNGQAARARCGTQCEADASDVGAVLVRVSGGDSAILEEHRRHDGTGVDRCVVVLVLGSEGDNWREWQVVGDHGTVERLHKGIDVLMQEIANGN